MVDRAADEMKIIEKIVDYGDDLNSKENVIDFRIGKSSF